jgi:hypothetical protein
MRYSTAFLVIALFAGCRTVGNVPVCHNEEYRTVSWYTYARRHDPDNHVIEDAFYLCIYISADGTMRYVVNGHEYTRKGLSSLLSQFDSNGRNSRGLRLRTAGIILEAADDVPLSAVRDVVRLFVKSGQKRFALFGLIEGGYCPVLEDDTERRRKGAAL